MRAAQADRTKQEYMRLPARAGTVPTATGNNNNKSELSANQRSLHMSGNRMRQRMLEGECMLSNGRYQHISIDIHTQTDGGQTIYIVIGEVAGYLDMSCKRSDRG